MPESAPGNRFIIVAIEYLSRWTVARAVRSFNSDETIRFTKEEIVTTFGTPKEIITDQGVNFTSDAFEQYLARIGVMHKRSSPYHPQTNGAVERVNRTLSEMLKKYSLEKGQRFWDETLSDCLSALRTREHHTTKKTPNEVVFGIKIGSSDQSKQTEAYREEARSNWENVKTKMEELYHRTPDTLAVGSWAHLRNTKCGKLDAVWSPNTSS